MASETSNGNGASRRVTAAFLVLCGIYIGWLSWLSISHIDLLKRTHALEQRNAEQGFTQADGERLKAAMREYHTKHTPPATQLAINALVAKELAELKIAIERTKQLQRELELQHERDLRSNRQ